MQSQMESRIWVGTLEKLAEGLNWRIFAGGGVGVGDDEHLHCGVCLVRKERKREEIKLGMGLAEILCQH